MTSTPNPIYLDYAAAGQFEPDQLEGIFKDLKSLPAYGNPLGATEGGAQMAQQIDQMRQRLLKFFGTSIDAYSIIFVSNSTAASQLLAETFEFRNLTANASRHRFLVSEESHGTTSLRSFAVDATTTIESPALVYLNDNHSSILGMREPAVQRRASVYCIAESELERRLCAKQRQESLMNVDSVSLFVYPSESNFNGRKYPLRWIKRISEIGLGAGKWLTFLDATAMVPTSPLNLSATSPDFVALSFNKMFGYPTGIGALLVKNSTGKSAMKKCFFGGGSAGYALPGVQYHEEKAKFCENFEFGTISYLDIISLKHGLDAIEKFGGMRALSLHVAGLATCLAQRLKRLRHHTGRPVVEIYSKTGFDATGQSHGGKVAFNILNPNGSYVPMDKMKAFAIKYGLQIGLGNFCNMGALQAHLGISDEQVLDILKSPTKTRQGKPLSVIRVSFGKGSNSGHVGKLIEAIQEEFVEYHLTEE